jgi:signal transduction histidine kinase/DNA-binding response OmpR family regulator
VYEIQLRRKNGDLIWGLISGAPVRNAQGKVVGSIGIQFDLTERKKLETELAEAKLMADRARLAERQFLTHMSHEIRTPINAVIGMTHLLDESNPNPVQKEYLNSLRFSADSLLGIIDNILDLSKIDAGEIDFEQKNFDLAYLLKSLLQTFQFKIAEKDLRIIEKMDPAITNLVIGDPTRTNQILTNLLGNALKFTENGLISLTTRLLDSSDGSYHIEFRVHDTGIGIPQDKLHTIFEYFKQADVQISRKFGGTGLGLTIVKQLVEMQGGTIRVESQLGHGSDFIITMHFGNSGIPVTEQALIPELNQQTPDKRISGLHFLIVEDNLLNQKLFCKTLDSWGCSYMVANNGVEALAKTAEQRFDIILMDIHMPELDGCETTLIIRNDPRNPNRDVPIIALTAAAMPEEKRRAFEVGMNGFLTKPIAPKMLQAYLLRSIKDAKPLETSTPEPPVEEMHNQLDLSYLLDLSNGDLQFVQNIMEAFLVETPAVLQNLETLVKTEDWVQAAKLVHKLKPNLAMFGFKTLQEQAEIFETSVHNKSATAAQLNAMAKILIEQATATLPLLAAQKRKP